MNIKLIALAIAFTFNASSNVLADSVADLLVKGGNDNGSIELKVGDVIKSRSSTFNVGSYKLSGADLRVCMTHTGISANDYLDSRVKKECLVYIVGSKRKYMQAYVMGRTDNAVKAVLEAEKHQPSYNWLEALNNARAKFKSLGNSKAAFFKSLNAG